MRGEFGDRIRLMHIIDAIHEVESYILNVDFDIFMQNSMMRFACIKQIEIIGEASNHISQETKSKFSSVAWSQIIGMRNVLVHEYFGVDSNLVWEIIKTDLPELKNNVSEIIKNMD